MDCAKIQNLIFFFPGEQPVSVGIVFKFLFKKLVLYLLLKSGKESVREGKECAQGKKSLDVQAKKNPAFD